MVKHGLAPNQPFNNPRIMTRSIILSTAEVQSVLNGGTCFRRVMKYQITNDEGDIVSDVVAGQFHPTVIDKDGDEQPGDEVWGAISDNAEWCVKCPWQPGDELYVREAFVFRHKYDQFYFKADHPTYDPYCHNGWKSPATMPRLAARIFLRVKSVSVEKDGDKWYWSVQYSIISTGKTE